MEGKEPKRKFSFFEITSIILIVLLVVGIFVEIIVMTNLKGKTENLQKEEKEIPSPEQENFSPILNSYLEKIEASIKTKD